MVSPLGAGHLHMAGDWGSRSLSAASEDWNSYLQASQVNQALQIDSGVAVKRHRGQHTS